MNYLQKLFMLTVLGLGVYVNETLPTTNTSNVSNASTVLSEDEITAQIQQAIEKRINSVDRASIEKEFKKLFEGLKLDIHEILKNAPNEPKYNNLRNAIASFSISNVRILLMSPVIDNKTREEIIKLIPMQYRFLVVPNGCI